MHNSLIISYYLLLWFCSYTLPKAIGHNYSGFWKGIATVIIVQILQSCWLQCLVWFLGW